MAGSMMRQMGQFAGNPNQQRMGMQNQQFPFGLINQGQQRPKPQYDNKLCLYIGNLTATTFDNDIFKFFKNRGYNLRNA